MFYFKHLRLSNFRTHLEMLEEEGAAGGAYPAAPMRGAASGPWCGSDSVQYAFGHIAADSSYMPPGRLSALYGEVPQPEDEAGPRRARSRSGPSRPPWRCDSDAVAAELRLRPGLTRAELRRIRRDFALSNHPDRVPPSWRDEANQRMTIANALIDRALKERAACGR